MMGTTTNNNPRSSQLIQPSTYRPWNVEVVAAVPQSIGRFNDVSEPKKKKKKCNTPLDASQICAGSVCPGWACLGSSKGTLFVWPLVSGNNTTQSASSTSGALTTKSHGVIDAPKTCVTLFHPTLAASTSPPLIALTPASPDAVFVYAAQPSRGELFVWKVTQDDVRKATTKLAPIINYAHTMLPLQRDNDDDDDGDDYNGNNNNNNNSNQQDEETVTSLTAVDRQLVVLGTSKGGLICCTQTTIPVSLHAQRMVASSSASRSRLSLAGLFWRSGSDHDATQDGSPIAFELPFCKSLSTYNGDDDDDDETTELLALSLRGSICHWKIEPTTGHRVFTEGFFLTSLVALFQENLSSSFENVIAVETLESKLLESHLHVLVRTTTEGSEIRLYWVRLHVQAQAKKVGIAWIDCHWLNRFPAPLDVDVMGLVLSQNGVAYAAFHQRSGGVTSSVIVMALVDAANGETENENGDDSLHTIYEVDLPMHEIPALIRGTFVNDLETHGCCVFARSGIGIRVRVLPPDATPLSPRAAARANPSAVFKLTNHVRSAFWQAYQYQGKTGSAALPPSIISASPVDLEEAVIAVATQLHIQRSSDGAGWTLASTALEANGLEFHLAFIQWLRQGGLYRSLSNYAKWKLLSLGQEVSAFLELIAPTLAPTTTAWEQEQFSKLNLSRGIAPWLKETLSFVLRDGSLDQYTIWCGWFSTALATAMSYREERISTPYDITPADKPPMVGSLNDDDDTQTTRVPVWTSDPVLQEIFGTLLQHWRLHPKPKSVHVLPPQTVEVIIKAALTSFADSASSLNTERALGKYGEIKSMTIPLLRVLHPQSQSSSTHPNAFTDDMLAFQLSVRHEYYEGLCQISHDHQHKPDAEHFKLEELLKSTTQCQSVDFQTGLSFGQFVLQWQTNHEKYGHAILLGRYCQERDLNVVLQSNERLRPYRWIQSIHRGDYDGAAQNLMTRAQDTSSVTLSETKWALCMAKLSNQVILKELTSQQDMASERNKKIDSTLELVGVQNELLGSSWSRPSSSQSEQHLWSASRLLSLALDKVDEATTSGSKSPKENATRFCYLGLLICTTIEDKDSQRSNAAQVWAKSILVDWESQWVDWIRTEDDLSREMLATTIIDSTVFGGLLQECGEDATLGPVAYSRETMEHDVLERLGLGGAGFESLRRLLYNVTTTFQENLSPANDEDMLDAVQDEGAMMVS